MNEALISRAQLQACHAWVFRKYEATEYDALHVWYINRTIE